MEKSEFLVSDHQAVWIPSQYEADADAQKDMLVSMEDVENVVNDGGGGTMYSVFRIQLLDHLTSSTM